MPALTTPLNKALTLHGVTAALVPALVGRTVFERETPFRLRSLKQAPGVLTQRVTRANGTGLLTFAYRLTLTETDYDAELLMALSYATFGLHVSYADFRVDGPGNTSPSTLDSSPMQGFSFKFTYGFSVNCPTRFAFLSTNAREFSEAGGKLKLVTGMRHIELDVAAPTSVTAIRRVNVAELAGEAQKASADNPADAAEIAAETSNPTPSQDQ